MISHYRYDLPSLPRSALRRALGVYGLATARLGRYLLSKQQDDLEQSILGFTEIVLSLPLRHPFLNIHQAFHHLAVALFILTDESRQPEDAQCCIMYLRYLRGLPHHVHNPDSPSITAALVSALALHAKSELEDVNQDIEEMADLCDELLNSDTSTC